MPDKHENCIKAIALVSTGLDSMLAALIMRNAGLDVLALHCHFRFDPTGPQDPTPAVESVFGPLDIPFRVLDVTDEYFKMLLDPRHGYGKGVNPCIDCKIFFFQQAKSLMIKTGAKFIITGEVVGQRPMSQMRNMLRHIEKSADLRGLVVRPLCGKLLDPTLPEQRGWISRDDLYDFSGRSRKGQMALATQLGILQYNQPAGGCILTNPQYANRARVLFKNRSKETLSVPDLQILRLGRHLWPSETLHVIVGRDESENSLLESFRTGRWAFEPAHFGGPLVLAEGVASNQDIQLVAEICARYCGKKAQPSCVISYVSEDTAEEITVEPLDPELTKAWLV